MAVKPIRSSFAKSVKFNYDMSEFEANAKKVIEDIQHETKNMLIKASTDFADGAAKATPPSIGKASIEKKYWSRPILVLGLLIRNKYPNHKPTKEDYAQYHNKMKYKVLYTKSGIKKGTAFAYTKTKTQAKKAAKIETRGLSRVMWGKNLASIGATVPNSILRILAKSTKLNNLNFNTVKVISEKDEQGIEITNSVTAIERYAKKAELAGYRKVSNALMREMKKIAEKPHEL